MKSLFRVRAYLPLALTILLVLVGCSSNNGNDQENNEDTISLTFAYELPTDHPWGIGAEKFKEIVEEKTNGKIKIELHGGGSLASSGREIQEGVEIGTIDIGISSTPLAQINPFVEIFSLPYLFSDRENTWEVLDGPIGDQVGSYLEERNIKHLAYWEDGFRQVTNNSHPIKSPEDFKGLRIRVPESSVRIATFEALGASPVSMSFSEVFTALQQGVIDGQENPLSVVTSSSFYDVQEYLTLTNHVYSPASLLINLDKWNSLSAEQQDIILEAAQAGRDVNRELNKKQDEEAIETLKEKGMQVEVIEDIAPFREATRSVWSELTDKLGEEGQEIVDSILETQKR